MDINPMSHVGAGKNRQAERPIGIFDSGLGGLTVARQLRRALPHEDFVYLGDTARVPYGTKSPTAVIQFAFEAAQFLMTRNVKAIVVACNTATAWALKRLEHGFPVPIFGVIAPGASAALRKTRNNKIGVIATPATIRSDAYRKAILTHNKKACVYSRPCPLLVPLVEEGWQAHAVTHLVLEEYLTPLSREGIDTLVLGCTHYPLLKRAIRKVVGRQISLVDSAATCAAEVREKLEEEELLIQGRRRQGRFDAYVTDEAPTFAHLCSQLLKLPKQKALTVLLPPWNPGALKRSGRRAFRPNKGRPSVRIQ